MSDAAGAVDGVLRSAAARAVDGNTAVAVARDDGSWWAVLPDVLLLELAANGASLTDPSNRNDVERCGRSECSRSTVQSFRWSRAVSWLNRCHRVWQPALGIWLGGRNGYRMSARRASGTVSRCRLGSALGDDEAAAPTARR